MGTFDRGHMPPWLLLLYMDYENLRSEGSEIMLHNVFEKENKLALAL